MRLITLNLRHGGGKRMPGLQAWLLAQGAHLLVLTEFRHNPVGAGLREALQGAGYVHQAASGGEPGVNSLLIASRLPLAPQPARGLALDRLRLLQVAVGGFVLTAAHLPNLKAKIPHWAALLRQAKRQRAAPHLYVGDFNTGLRPEDADGYPHPFTGEAHMRALLQLGWRDAWRHFHPEGREYTWYSHRGRGFRLDHAFCAPALAGRLNSARFEHAPREQRLTDHSALRVDFTP